MLGKFMDIHTCEFSASFLKGGQVKVERGGGVYKFRFKVEVYKEYKVLFP